MKRCVKCNKLKTLDTFSKDSRNKNGTASICKKCKCKVSAHYQLKHREERSVYNKEYFYNQPWRKHYRNAKSRCENKKHWNFKNYGGRGIKFFLTVEDIKMLWFRDKAYELKQPSIDRKDNDGDYTLNNCRFIEKVRNVRHGKN